MSIPTQSDVRVNSRMRSKKTEARAHRRHMGSTGGERTVQQWQCGGLNGQFSRASPHRDTEMLILNPKTASMGSSSHATEFAVVASPVRLGVAETKVQCRETAETPRVVARISIKISHHVIVKASHFILRARLDGRVRRRNLNPLHLALSADVRKVENRPRILKDYRPQVLADKRY